MAAEKFDVYRMQDIPIHRNSIENTRRVHRTSENRSWRWGEEVELHGGRHSRRRALSLPNFETHTTACSSFRFRQIESFWQRFFCHWHGLKDFVSCRLRIWFIRPRWHFLLPSGGFFGYLCFFYLFALQDGHTGRLLFIETVSLETCTKKCLEWKGNGRFWLEADTHTNTHFLADPKVLKCILNVSGLAFGMLRRWWCEDECGRPFMSDMMCIVFCVWFTRNFCGYLGSRDF